MESRAIGAFVTGRLVQHQVSEGTVLPVLAINAERQAGTTIAAAHGKARTRVLTHFTADADQSGLDQQAAFLAAAEALGLQNSFELHACNGSPDADGPGYTAPLHFMEKILQFEHLVEVNDPGNPTEALLSREQLWFGLLCRAEDGRAFLPGLDQCRIVERSEGLLRRELHFGEVLIRDQVRFEPLQWMCFETEANAEHAGGSLTIRIEEPAPGALFLRFQYLTSLAETDSGDDIGYADFVRSAYHQSDIDTVRVIRMIAHSIGPEQ